MTAQVIRAIYAPVIDVHWVTVKQLAQLEPTLVETTGCMIGQFLKDSMDHAIHEVGIPEKAVRSEEHTSELQSRGHLVCRLLLEKKKKTQHTITKKIKTKQKLPNRHRDTTAPPKDK